MKNTIKIGSLIALFAAVLFTSCDNEPLDPDLNIDDFNTSSVAGNYKLTAFNTTVPTDLNGDGTNSTNQLSETNCFDNTFLSLNADHTFVADSKGIDIVDNALSCFEDDDLSGTWALEGNNLVLTYVDPVDGNTYADSFSVQGSVLKHTATGGDIVGTTSTGEPVYLTSNIEFIYSKQ